MFYSGGRQSGAVLYNAFGVMGRSDTGGKAGVTKSNGSTGSQTGSGYSTDVSDDNLPHDPLSPASDANEHSDSDDQVRNGIYKRCLIKHIRKKTILKNIIEETNKNNSLSFCRTKGLNQMILKKSYPSCPLLLTPAA